MSGAKTRIAFFGHDAGDAAIRRRVAGLQATGCDVTGFMMRRGPDEPRAWENVDLGRTRDAAYWQRLTAIVRGGRIALKQAELLRAADLIIARNLDMLIVAMNAKRRLRLKAPVVYECLDIHHLLTRSDPLGGLLRRIEKRLIRATALLVYSSPAFEREFFKRCYGGLYTPFLLENRLVDTAALPPRPSAVTAPATPLRLGWFGMLRCARTLRLLTALADDLGSEIEIITAGIPALTQVPDFEEQIAARANMHFSGRYTSPEDLPGLYGSVDIVWAGDFYQAGYNSKWLLPNRIYEGGYFAVPAIAPADSETGRWLERHRAGFTPAEPLEATLPDLVRDLITHPAKISARASALRELPRSTFVQPVDELADLVKRALESDEREAA